LSPAARRLNFAFDASSLINTGPKPATIKFLSTSWKTGVALLIFKHVSMRFDLQRRKTIIWKIFTCRLTLNIIKSKLFIVAVVAVAVFAPLPHFEIPSEKKSKVWNTQF
jgi:hypothetical protein